MKRLQLVSAVTFGLALSITGCKDGGGGDDDAADESSSSDTGMQETGGDKFDVGDTGMGGCNDADGSDECPNQLDLLFVIDNSGSMGEEQLNLALNFPLLIKRLEELEDAEGNLLEPNVNIMVTTSDYGNPLCTPFYKPGRSAEQGIPISSGCNSRIERFESITVPPVNQEPACTTVCPMDVEPMGDFINFSIFGDNVDAVPDNDINGDGEPDSPVAQALACIGPQGIDGCGMESPLESMLSAIAPDKAWNTAEEPFLRGGGLLAVVMITDEADCSLADESIVNDSAFWGTDPDDGIEKPTSAICWNAGVTCAGPDGNGVYSDCASINDGNMHPTSRYTDRLIGELRDAGKEVVMLGILGVPKVTEHNPDPPFQPTAGGVFTLEYRDWRDPDFPNGGDILPDEWADMVTAAHKQFDFGIGPGCTGEDGMGGFTGQAIPPVRVKEVCEALNYVDGDGEEQIRCCIESICDTDFSAAIECLTGIISEVVVIPPP